MPDNASILSHLASLRNEHDKSEAPPQECPDEPCSGELDGAASNTRSSLAVEGELARGLRPILYRAGCYDGPTTGEYDALTRRALIALVGNENTEERCDEVGGLISSQVLDIVRKSFAR